MYIAFGYVLECSFNLISNKYHFFLIYFGFVFEINYNNSGKEKGHFSMPNSQFLILNPQYPIPYPLFPTTL